jgi:hypothetical protein
MLPHLLPLVSIVLGPFLGRSSLLTKIIRIPKRLDGISITKTCPKKKKNSGFP